MIAVQYSSSGVQPESPQPQAHGGAQRSLQTRRPQGIQQICEAGSRILGISILYDVGHREGRKKNLGGWRFDDARFKRPILNSAALRRGFPRLGWSRQVAPVSTPARGVQAAERPARFLYKKKNSEVAFGRYRATLASGILEQGQ